MNNIQKGWFFCLFYSKSHGRPLKIWNVVTSIEEHSPDLLFRHSINITLIHLISSINKKSLKITAIFITTLEFIFDKYRLFLTSIFLFKFK